MRLAFFILLAANAALLAVSLLSTSEPEHRRQQIAKLQLHPESLRLISGSVTSSEAARAEVTREPANSQLITPQPTAFVCLEWAGIAPQDLERSRMLLASLAATYKPISGGKGTLDHYRVHIPDLKTSAAVNALLIELRAAGERDFAVARSAAEGTYDISLGVFKSEERAKQRYERFRSRGAVLTPRGADRTSYLVQDLGADSETFIAAAQNVPGTTLTVITCPEPPPLKDKHPSLKTSSG